jgi:hypothetical protein
MPVLRPTPHTDDAHVYVGAWEDGVFIYALPPDAQLRDTAPCR